MKTFLMTERNTFDPFDPRFFVSQIFVAWEDFLNSLTNMKRQHLLRMWITALITTLPLEIMPVVVLMYNKGLSHYLWNEIQTN